MRPFTTRKPPSLPTSSYKDKPLSSRPLSIRLKLRYYLKSHPYVLLSILFLFVFLVLAWSIGLMRFGEGERKRMTTFGEGLKVQARDYSHDIGVTRAARGGRVVDEKNELLISEDRLYNETVLVRRSLFSRMAIRLSLTTRQGTSSDPMSNEELDRTHLAFLSTPRSSLLPIPPPPTWDPRFRLFRSHLYSSTRTNR